MDNSTSLYSKKQELNEKLENIMSASNLITNYPEIRKLSAELCENIKLLIEKLIKKASENPDLVYYSFGGLTLLATLVYLFLKSLNLSQELKEHESNVDKYKRKSHVFDKKIEILLEAANKQMKSDNIKELMETIKYLMGKFDKCLSDLKDILENVHVVAQTNMKLQTGANYAFYGSGSISAVFAVGAVAIPPFCLPLVVSALVSGAAALTSYNRSDSLNEKEKQLKNLLDDMYECEEEIEKTMENLDLHLIDVRHRQVQE